MRSPLEVAAGALERIAARMRKYTDARLPSHISPPFRATQWWQDNGNTTLLAGNSVLLFSTRFSGRAALATTPSPTGQFGLGEPVPDGRRAEMTYLFWQATVVDAVQFNPSGQVQAFVVKNGIMVPGYQRLNPSYLDSITVATVPCYFFHSGPRVLAPIHLEPGDTLDIRLSTEVTVNFVINLAWGGWLYPPGEEGDLGSIRSTSGDPGAHDPLS